jgi:hypothetical protein
MNTRASELIEQTLRQWDDYAAIEQEERLECVMAHIERQRVCAPRGALAAETQAAIARPGYTTSHAWQRIESRHE